jgi:hypothetical protein
MQTIRGRGALHQAKKNLRPTADIIKENRARWNRKRDVKLNKVISDPFPEIPPSIHTPDVHDNSI